MDFLLNELIQYWTAVKDFLAIDPSRLQEPEIMGRLILQLLLLCGSAFFSGSETALFSLSRLDLQKLRKERNRHSETLHALLDQPRRLIISILCGNELINIAAAVNMTGILVTLYGSGRVELINALVMVPLLLLFGEVTPKTIAVSNPVRISTGIVATPMSLWIRVVAPLRWVIRIVADRSTTLIVGEEKTADNILQIDEFRSLVEEVAKEGELNATERALIYNVLEAGETEIVEIMTPRTQTKFINATLSVPEMIEEFKAYRHPRVPVYRHHRDNLVGFIHAEDILRLIMKKVDFTTLKRKDIMHPPVIAPLTKKVDEMFDFFQANNVRAAAVLNEFGGVEGFITMKDVITFIFGDVSGDVSGEELYQERDENVYEVPGNMKLNDFNNLTNFGIEDPRMTTIGGVAFRHLDSLPRIGDKVTVEDITITVLEMDGHRIAKVRVARGAPLEEELEETSAQQDKLGPVSLQEDQEETVVQQDAALETSAAALSEQQGKEFSEQQEDSEHEPMDTPEQASTETMLATDESVEADSADQAMQADETSDEPSNELAGAPADELTEKPADAPAEESADASTEESADAPIEEPAEEPADTPTEEPTDAPTEEPADAPKKPAENAKQHKPEPEEV